MDNSTNKWNNLFFFGKKTDLFESNVLKLITIE